MHTTIYRTVLVKDGLEKAIADSVSILDKDLRENFIGFNYCIYIYFESLDVRYSSHDNLTNTYACVLCLIYDPPILSSSLSSCLDSLFHLFNVF